LSEHLDQLLANTAGIFASPADYQRMRTQWLAGLLNLGRHTVTGALTTAGREHQDWSADYRVLQRLPVEPLFHQLQQQTLARSEGPWIVAIDDSATRKTGRRIPGCGWRRDPLSPPFHVNFHWGQRVLQCSAALPAPDGSARLVPIDWTEAPLPKKPARHAGADAHAAYAEARRQANLNALTARRLAHLRTVTDRPIHFVVDGRFTNRTVLRQLPENTVVIGRIRKDTKLYAETPRQKGTGRPRRYGAGLPTPEQLRTDEQIPWQGVRAWAIDREHAFKLKATGAVMARIRGVIAPVRIVVIAPLGYRLRKGSRILYRQPAYLLCTDPTLPLEHILQEYLWRWDIEVNLRDEKCLLGVSEAQLRQPEAVQRQPAAAVAAYGFLLLAAHDAYGHHGRPPAVPLPRWRRRVPPRRPTTAHLISQLRVELWSQCLRRQTLSHFRSRSRHDQKSHNLGAHLASAVFHAHN
jgi:hypothetical protein